MALIELSIPLSFGLWNKIIQEFLEVANVKYIFFREPYHTVFYITINFWSRYAL